MNQHQKILRMILSGMQDQSIVFSNLQTLLLHLGFQCRTRGDHFIFTKDGVEEISNLQPRGAKAKAYQVKQVRQIILKYHFGGAISE